MISARFNGATLGRFVRAAFAAGATSEQHRFAREHGARLGPAAGPYGRLVFVYREEGWRTFRWLIDANGEVVDFVSLQRRGVYRQAALSNAGGAGPSDVAPSGRAPRASGPEPAPVAPSTHTRSRPLRLAS